MSYSPYMTSVPYGELIRWRTECHARFGGILDLPSGASPYAVCKGCLNGGLVLDIGAGADHALKNYSGVPDALYRSLDTDPAGKFDYASLDEIPGGGVFGLIVMNQFLEHLALNDGIDVLRAAYGLLSPGGKLVISIPNAHHPVRFHSTVTHITNWPFNDFYAVLRQLGFEVDSLFRSNKRPLPGNPVKRLLTRWICEEFRIDWCDSLIAVASRPAQ